MFIFIDGFQTSGKSTLINNCKYKHRRFPFNQYLDLFPLDLNTFQITKDLAILFLAEAVKDNIVFDRGPFSTIFYSLKEDRFGKDTTKIVRRFLGQLKEFPNCEFVFVKKINETEVIKREHNDGFDYLNDDDDPQKDVLLDSIIYEAEKVGIKIHIFENDFSISLKQNYHRFNDLLEELIDEHDRD